jgi:hypothetical protein
MEGIKTKVQNTENQTNKKQNNLMNVEYSQHSIFIIITVDVLSYLTRWIPICISVCHKLLVFITYIDMSFLKDKETFSY